ncbi:hypothetical protein OEZ85_009975 [Tetradesmus obliquus]|uniref:Uncharacterized protein n=1 Tax=Tetradesmus obliquus TaxID=3088 RepID=A0ABY8UB38_TETOB|nr:hypothetical protein OEZ85_009975 [Tetradesmus obliquus]
MQQQGQLLDQLGGTAAAGSSRELGGADLDLDLDLNFLENMLQGDTCGAGDTRMLVSDIARMCSISELPALPSDVGPLLLAQQQLQQQQQQPDTSPDNPGSGNANNAGIGNAINAGPGAPAAANNTAAAAAASAGLALGQQQEDALLSWLQADDAPFPDPQDCAMMGLGDV